MQVGPVLEAMEDVLALLLRSLDGRVYVAVGRGLWDFTSKDIYDYVDSLQEGKENKVSVLFMSSSNQESFSSLVPHCVRTYFSLVCACLILR